MCSLFFLVKPSNPSNKFHLFLLAGEDFSALSASRTFQPGQTGSECVPVTVVDDAIPEGTEQFTLTLSSADPDVSPSSVLAQGTIEDNDGM